MPARFDALSPGASHKLEIIYDANRHMLRALLGAFYAAMPTVSAARIADITAPEQRGAMVARLGAANGLGMVLGPAIGGLLVKAVKAVGKVQQQYQKAVILESPYHATQELIAGCAARKVKVRYEALPHYLKAAESAQPSRAPLHAAHCTLALPTAQRGSAQEMGAAGAVLLLLGGLVAVLRAPAWPGMGNRYDRDAAPRPRQAETPADLWKSLDAGDDPTLGGPEGGATTGTTPAARTEPGDDTEPAPLAERPAQPKEGP